jgi:signal transduction histidine kinase
MQETLDSLARRNWPQAVNSLARKLEVAVSTKLSPRRQIALCAITLLVTTALGWRLHDEFQLTPVLLCLVSSIFVSLFTNLGIALTSSLVNALSADYFFIGPIGEIVFNFHFMLRVLVFLGTSLLVNLLVGMLRRSYLSATGARRLAERFNREKDEILAILSHDLRSPLTAALLSIQLVERQLPPGDPLLRHTTRARDACRRVTGLVLDLLDSSKVTSGGLPILAELQDAAALVTSVVSELQVIAAPSGIRIETSLEPCELRCDGQRLSQLVSNLVTNALKFTPRGGVVSVRLARELGWACLEVRDTGIGMTEQQISHVFDRFWQAERASRNGVGLGLFIVKAIADAHGAAVHVESQLHKGSCFLVKFPL